MPPPPTPTPRRWKNAEFCHEAHLRYKATPSKIDANKFPARTQSGRICLLCCLAVFELLRWFEPRNICHCLSSDFTIRFRSDSYIDCIWWRLSRPTPSLRCEMLKLNQSFQNTAVNRDPSAVTVARGAFFRSIEETCRGSSLLSHVWSSNHA